MNKRHYEHTLPNIRGSLSNTYVISNLKIRKNNELCKQFTDFQYPYLIYKFYFRMPGTRPGVRLS